jgi:UDP-N-acetylmuramate dehydrogenase
MRRCDPRAQGVPPRMINATAEGNGYTIVENASLEGRNTFHVPARADLLIDVRKRDALQELFGFAALKSRPVLVLGEGSNILFTRDWPGVVLSMATRGIEVQASDSARARIRVEAGENWNDFVHWSIGQGFAGLENLVAIPGTVGAAPMQNIGAYGVEVREFVVRVEAWDREAARFVELSNAACAFAYRDSVFKRVQDRYVITAVVFDLPRTREPRLDYTGVREELDALGASEPRPASIAEAITRIRMRKLPNPLVIGNAGSFFKNPLVAVATAETVRRDHPSAPIWPAGQGLMKLSAAWLVESCGFKGLREGDAGVSDAHALVLVNYGRASGADIGALAARIRVGVRERFGIELSAEPLIV